MAQPRVRQTPGELVARALFGSWRLNPPEFEIGEEEIETVTPRLLGSGGGALGWRRISSSPYRTSPGAIRLQQAYRLQTLYAGLHDVEIEQVIKMLAAAGLDPLLIKGRVAAALYPERGLRPYGDIDLCFDSAQYQTARTVLNTPERRGLQRGRQEDIDWDRCFGSEKRIVNWMACTIGLEHRLLGASYDGPRFARPKNLPRWLAPVVLRQWERPYPDWNETPEFLKFDLRKPAVLKSEICKRWPNPIKATVYFGGSFNEFPRLPFQLGNFISQGLRSLARLPRSL